MRRCRDDVRSFAGSRSLAESARAELSNDNWEAIAFYEAVGWRKIAVHCGAVNNSRQLKPEIPKDGMNGTPIEDEIEFEFPSTHDRVPAGKGLSRPSPDGQNRLHG